MKLLVLLALTGVAGAPEPKAPSPWRDACALSGYSCEGIEPPEIRFEALQGQLGRYRMGETFIEIDERLPARLVQAVAAHEMTHYLQWKHGDWQFTQESRCEMERRAFLVSNSVLLRSGLFTELVIWDEIRKWYGCEKADKDPEGVPDGESHVRGQGAPAR